MKILEINKFHFRGRGAENHFFSIVELLRKHGHKIAVFSMESLKNSPSQWSAYFPSEVGYSNDYSFWQKLKGVGRMFYSWETKRKLSKLLNDFQPDIVHIHNVYHQLPPIILFEIKRRGIPVVMTVHDYKIVNPNYNLCLNGKFYDRCKDGKYYQCVIDKCIKKSYVKSFLAMLEMYWHSMLGSYRKNVDQYVVPSEFTKTILIERGISQEKIVVLPHFVSSCTENDLPIKKNSNDSYALYAGSISQDKGARELIKLFHNVGDIRLCLAGKMESDISISSLSNARHLGLLSEKVLKNCIRNAKFVVSGSKLPETFGLIALEAIAEGTPFVGFRTGAFPEIIRNGENGFLVENEEEMRRVICKIQQGEVAFDPKRIRDEAQHKFNQEVYYEKLLKLFERQINAKKRLDY